MLNINNEINKSKTKLRLLRCVVFYSSFVCISAYANVYSKKIIILKLSPMRPNKLRTCQHDGAARAQAPGCQRSTCGSVRRGRGGDWCNQRRSYGEGWGSGHPRSPSLRNDPGTVTIPQHRFNSKTMEHTLTQIWEGNWEEIRLAPTL